MRRRTMSLLLSGPWVPLDNVFQLPKNFHLIPERRGLGLTYKFARNLRKLHASGIKLDGLQAMFDL